MKKLTGAILIVGSPEKVADLRYATGFSTVDPVVFLSVGRKKTLVVPVLEAGRAAKVCSRRVRILTPQEVVGKRSKRSRAEDWAAALLKKEGLRRAIVPGYLPVAVARVLKQRGIQVVIARGKIFPTRSVKTDGERRKMRQVQKAAVHAMRRAVDLLRRARIGTDGVLVEEGRRLTSERVRQEIQTALLEKNCSGAATIVAGGIQAADPHERGHGPLRAHEPIVVDIFPRSEEHGYWGDLTRTLVKGRASARVRDMHRAVARAHAAARALLRPGVAVRRIHRAVQRIFEEEKMFTTWHGARSEGFIHNTGHGVGLEVHEAPVIGDIEGRLKAGQVLTIEPGLYYRAVGGVRIEDTLCVTQRGWAYLYRCPDYFEI